MAASRAAQEEVGSKIEAGSDHRPHCIAAGLPCVGFGRLMIWKGAYRGLHCHDGVSAAEPQNWTASAEPQVRYSLLFSLPPNSPLPISAAESPSSGNSINVKALNDWSSQPIFQACDLPCLFMAWPNALSHPYGFTSDFCVSSLVLTP
jgi:hypothetical protein